MVIGIGGIGHKPLWSHTGKDLYQNYYIVAMISSYLILQSYQNGQSLDQRAIYVGNMTAIVVCYTPNSGIFTNEYDHL